jgi:hypothetical protein
MITKLITLGLNIIRMMVVINYFTYYTFVGFTYYTFVGFTFNEFDFLQNLTFDILWYAEGSMNDLLEWYTRNYSQFNYANQKLKYGSDCIICLDPFEQDQLLYELTCNHVFHYQCIDQWHEINKCCPVCR